MRNFIYHVKLISVILVLMFAANTAVLFFVFDVRLSDIMDFAACTLGLAYGDGSSKRDGSSEGDVSIKRDSSSKEAGFAVGDGSSKRDSSPKEASFPVGDSSSTKDDYQKGDISLEGDVFSKRDSSSTADNSQKGDSSSESSSGVAAGVIDIMNGLSLADKIALAGIIARMGGEGLEEVYKMSEDGITSDELHKIAEYAKAHLKPSDIVKLEEILQRNRHLYADLEK